MMRVVVGATVLVVIVLATPATRRGLSTRLESVTAPVRARVAAFRVDYAAREAELRERLLPDDAAVADAARYRTEAS